MFRIFGVFIETWQHKKGRLLASAPWPTLLLTPGCGLNHKVSLVKMCESPEISCPSSVQIPLTPGRTVTYNTVGSAVGAGAGVVGLKNSSSQC